ncbi:MULTISPECIES: terminase large subunit [unclassified Sphingobium]|uniref:terminase large subunit n=1 Tax=unclassified Sphingobium TaxID=2611147 RepID=UPI0022241061|nr:MULTISPECIES: terminase TerL endonuclease subunit [unclassified Sphingobium]MCW2412926.1 phage terminase large subunit-like protein [Sphingobium sp. B8D3D]MCW2414776.1 phage terminase large subunit-like protein [Sphingobium sp. B8D3A]
MAWLEDEGGPFTEKAVEYAEQVVAGDIFVCLQIRQACQRFLDDIDGDDWEFVPSKVERVCKFIELLPHVKAQWASKRELIRLEPWQVWILAGIFGFVDPVTRLRKVNEAALFIPRKQGKSTFAAGIGNYMAFLDGEAGAEVWIGANSMDQADACFVPCKLMVERTPDFREALGLEVYAKAIMAPDGSFVRTMIGKPGDGSNPHCAILDEAHENDTSEQYDTMKTGMGARAQPLLLTITTAGFNTAGPCRQLQVDAENVLAGNVKNNSLFAAIYTIDPADDWRDFEVWKKANPNFGVSVGEKYFRQQYDDAINLPQKRPTLLTKHLNVWQNASNGWLDQLDWAACKSSVSLADLKGSAAYIGFDLSTQTDITAVVLCVIDQHGKPHFFPFFFLPEGAIAKSKTADAYRAWVDAGHIQLTEGNATDFAAVKAKLVELLDVFDVRGMAYDSWQGHQMSQEMQSDFPNLPIVKFAQNIGNYNPVMQSFEALVADHKLAHNDNPCMNWMASNVSIRANSANHLFPNKPDKQMHLKIDGIVASLMAYAQHLNQTPVFEPFIDLL